MESRTGRATTGWVGVALPALLAIGAAACGGGDDEAGPPLSPAATEGRQIAVRAGCTACHGADGEGGTGPAWTGALGQEIELEDGATVVVDEAYLTRSITDPRAEVHAGFTVQMPENQLDDEEIAKVVRYIVALGGPAPTGAGT